MRSTLRYGGPLVASAVLWAFGCSTPTPPSATVQAPEPASADRSLMSVEEPADQPLTEDQAKQVLPARISVEDAKKMLVQLDQSKLGEQPKTYSVLRGGGHGGHGGGGGHGGHGWRGGHGYGRYGGYGFGRYGGYGAFGYGWPSYGFYGLGSYYYPYSLYGGYYYPYSYYPYYYGYRSLYYPYIW